MGLSACNLTVALGRRTVLHDLSLTLAPGRVTAVLGANGAGKSTLLRALSALVPALQGQVRLGERDMADIAASERAKLIGYLPQNAGAHWNMTVRDLVSLGRMPHRDGKAAAIDAALATTDVTALAARPIGTLSGGERARVFLARVLAGEPAWLLADEPLASLDPFHQLETLALLRTTAARGIGVVVVLHDLTQAARAADDILLLKDGRLLAYGPTSAVATEESLAATYGVKVAILDHAGECIITPTART